MKHKYFSLRIGNLDRLWFFIDTIIFAQDAPLVILEALKGIDYGKFTDFLWPLEGLILCMNRELAQE